MAKSRFVRPNLSADIDGESVPVCVSARAHARLATYGMNLFGKGSLQQLVVSSFDLCRFQRGLEMV